MRYQLLDTLRGFSLVSMILFHACWDLVYLFGYDWPWYKEPPVTCGSRASAGCSSSSAAFAWG
ncbi:MAG: DUF1624 domain-containing protein [Acidaminococcaceae bacterium]|nr:DUF1624 domain-containing protein [Acidaminococcaceae bacterium]